MFKKKKEESRIVSVISKNTKLEGVVESSEFLEISGEIKGELISVGSLAIHPEGKLVGTINGAEVAIHGEVEGSFSVSEVLRVGKTGVITGDCQARRLCTEQGAVLNGEVSMPGHEKPKDIFNIPEKNS